jgi:hypothetical protein
MWNVKAKVMPVLTGGLEASHNHSNNTLATYDEITISNIYTNQPYCALHTNCG